MQINHIFVKCHFCHFRKYSIASTLAQTELLPHKPIKPASFKGNWRQFKDKILPSGLQILSALYFLKVYEFRHTKKKPFANSKPTIL